MTRASRQSIRSELSVDQSVQYLAGFVTGAPSSTFNGTPPCPAKVIITTLSAAISSGPTTTNQVQRAYGDLCRGLRLPDQPLPVANPKKKGGRSGVKLIVKTASGPCASSESADANTKLMTWVMGEAGNRCHGTPPAKKTALPSSNGHVLKGPAGRAPECA